MRLMRLMTRTDVMGLVLSSGLAKVRDTCTETTAIQVALVMADAGR